LRDGTPYENTLECWAVLAEASKDARYLDLVSVDDFVDRRNSEAITNFKETSDPYYAVSGDSYLLGKMEEMPSLPDAWVTGGHPAQRYQIEIWCEKSTMNDVLEPIAERHGAHLITGIGELSTTRCNECVASAREDGRPVRIIYISDFDPVGRSMPVAVARKIEFFLRNGGLDLDIQLRPVVLTPEQCVQYRLPRTPIKKSERRAARFEERFGKGATELDALEALHPGELARIIRREIARYYGNDLYANTLAAAQPVQAKLKKVTERVHERHTKEIADLRKEYDDLIAARGEWVERAGPTWDAIKKEITDEAKGLARGIKWPEPKEGDEDHDPLFDSTRSYVEQMDSYKTHQGKPTERGAVGRPFKMADDE
jgi:hypothetical protein